MTKARTPTFPSSTPESGTEVKTTTAPCKGWIQIYSHYVDYNIAVDEDIAVGYIAKLYRVEGTSASLVETVTVHYQSLKQATASANGDPPADAVTNGNPKVNLGGTAGYDPGKYKLTLAPKIAFGKVRLKSTVETNRTYLILNTSGAESGQATDTYVQVPASTTVETEWSETFDLACGTITSPKVVTFAWADFKTWDAITTARITGSGNIGSLSLDASAGCLTTISANMTAALGSNWRQVAVTNAFFPLHPVIRYWAFVLINKTDELIGRKVRITNPGRSASYQTFLRERYLHCSGAKAAAPWKSNHQYGLAFDTGYGTNMTDAPPANSQTDTQVLVAAAIGLDWGGTWSDPDRPHFEYPNATKNTTNYRDQLNGTQPTVITYGGHQYVQNP